MVRLRIYLGILLVALLVSCKSKTKLMSEDATQITIGDKAPLFSLYDQDSTLITIGDYIGKSNIVIYFYPKDNTPGCTKEACSFRDNIESFNDLDAKVFGISSDDVESHKNFALKHNLNFNLLSDLKGEVRRQYGVKSDFFGILDGRETFIIDKKGEIVHTVKSQLNPSKHIKEAIASLKENEN